MWRGHKTRMGWGQEANDAECAALARALQVAASRNHTLGLVTILMDCQTAIGRMTFDEPGPGQYALEARRHIATLRPRSLTSRSRSGGAQATGVSGETRLPTNGRQTNRMPTGLNGFRPQTRTARSARESSRSRGPSPTSSEGSPKGDAGRQRLGQEVACPHQQPQIPAKRKAETGPRPTSASPPGFTS